MDVLSTRMRALPNNGALTKRSRPCMYTLQATHMHTQFLSTKITVLPLYNIDEE